MNPKFFLWIDKVSNAGRTPVGCTSTGVGMPDYCQIFAPKANESTTECQESLKGADYLKICTFTNGLKMVDYNRLKIYLKNNEKIESVIMLGFQAEGSSDRPKPNKKCKRVKCTHRCYIPCVYFIARNRTFKDTGDKEFKLSNYATYSCKNENKDLICGCASVAE